MQIITITFHFLPRQLAAIFSIAVFIRMEGIQQKRECKESKMVLLNTAQESALASPFWKAH